MLLLEHNTESMNKFSSKRTSSNCIDSYSKHRRADYSPPPRNGGRSRSRNSSPDSWSPKPDYVKHSTYTSRRSRERERERDKYYDGGAHFASQSKYSSRSSRSPLRETTSSRTYKSSRGRSRERSRDANYENNNHSYSSSRRTHFGDWTEQTSTQGRLYYFNIKTESSQWDKPKDWLEWERKHAKYNSSSTSIDPKCSDYHRDRHLNSSKYDYATSREKTRPSRYDDSPSSRSRYNSRSRDERKMYESDRRKISDSYDYHHHHHSHHYDHQPPTQHHHHYSSRRDRSSSYSSQERQLKESPRNNNNNNSKHNHIDDPACQTNHHHPMSTHSSRATPEQPFNITKLKSLANSVDMMSNENSLSAMKNVCNAASYSSNANNHANNVVASTKSYQSPSQSKFYSQNSKNYRHVNNSEGKLSDLDRVNKNCISSPDISSPSHSDSRGSVSNFKNDNGPSSNLTSICSIASSVTQKPTLPSLNRFKQFYREDLSGHVLGWHSEQYDKQTKNLNDQINLLSNHSLTRVEAELKIKRSLFRLDEIHKNIQQHKIVLLNQQIQDVDEWKGKQVSNYS